VIGKQEDLGRRSDMAESEELGVIGEIEEDGLPVVFKFVDLLPPEETRARLGWLTVISWKYDGGPRNGMPATDTNARMLALEHALDDIEQKGHCRHAYSRTGNSLKEFVYYIADRERFIAAFNDALAGHPRYPIEIHFYEDRGWSDLQKIRELFRRAT